MKSEENMRKVPWFLACISCAVVSVVCLAKSGDGAEKSEQKSPVEKMTRSVVASSNGIELTLTMPVKCWAGESCNGQMTVVNRAAKTIKFNKDDGPLDWYINMVGESPGVGRKTAFGGRVLNNGFEDKKDRIVENMVTDLAPGDSFTRTINMARLFDLTVSGFYKCKVKRYLRDSDKNYVCVASGPLEFKVTDNLAEMLNGAALTDEP